MNCLIVLKKVREMGIKNVIMLRIIKGVWDVESKNDKWLFVLLYERIFHIFLDWLSNFSIDWLIFIFIILFVQTNNQ